MNTVDALHPTEFPTIDLACLIVEYKKATGSRHIRQLTMAMVSSLHHLCMMGLQGFDWPIFGLLVEGSVATLHVAWMKHNQQVSINI
jgi:hypothetical protein